MSGYEVGTKVKVVSCREDYDSYVGRTGVVIRLGRDADDLYEFDYKVSIDDSVLELPFFAEELEKLNEAEQV